MKMLKRLTALALICPALCFAQNPTMLLKIPFYNVNVSQSTKVVADYQFNPLHQMLVCTSTSLAAPQVYWTYKNAEYAAIIPAGGHISLKDHDYPEGYFADPNGRIKIINSDKADLLLSCEYHTWG